MTKSEMRKALQDGMKVYIESGKSITKCEVLQHRLRPHAHKPRMQKEEVEIDTLNLPMALQIRFGLQKKQ